jgi:ATF/CREB family transcription factor
MLVSKEPTATESTAQPLGPPPRPKQANGENGDYFSQAHGASGPIGPSGPYGTEPNPFEAQFSNPATDTPGKIGLPSVAALTSPASLLPGDTPGWSSLRSGPLSPAMLAGPTGGTDYFDSNFSRGFPTPNESSLRTGLTPGGGGSMFPAPSPNSQSLFNSLQLGANTPGTLEFLRTGVAAKAAANGIAPTSQPTADSQSSNNLDLKLPATSAPSAESYAQHDTDAANGLFMLAQSNGARSGNSFAVPQQPVSNATNAINASAELVSANSRAQKNSITSGTTQVDSSDSDESEPSKPATRSRGKRAAEPKTNNRRKATDNPGKTPASKRQKNNNNIPQEPKSPPSSDMEEDGEKNGRKMTDEEKRKNFLERNRYDVFCKILVGIIADMPTQCRCSQVPTAKEAMAPELASQG